MNASDPHFPDTEKKTAKNLAASVCVWPFPWLDRSGLFDEDHFFPPPMQFSDSEFTASGTPPE
jgi:hypothetical protein